MPKCILSTLIALVCLTTSADVAADSVTLLQEADSISAAVETSKALAGKPLSESLPLENAKAWLHITLANPDTAVLHFPSHSVGQYSVYSIETQELLETFTSPFQAATTIDWTPKFTLPLDRSWGNEFIVQLNMLGITDMAYSLMSFEQYQDLVSDQLINNGIFYGSIALMALFSFLLYLLNNDKHAGRLSASFLIWLLTMLSIWGFGTSPMPFGLSDLLPPLTNQFTILGSLAGTVFAFYFLRDSIADSTIYKILQGTIWLQVIYFIVSFAIEPLWSFSIVINILCGWIAMGCCGLATVRRDAAAKYLLASSALISCPFVFIFIAPLNQQTLIAVGMGALVLVMLALLQRMAEQTQRWAMKADLASERERFLASMSHEIRTPLNGIIGFSELVNQEQLEGKVHNYFKQIDRSSKVLLGIVNEVLDYAKLQATEITPNFKPLNIKETLEDVITVNLPTANKNHIDLSYEVDKNLPNYVTTDPQRCLQVLINLCGNAVKFSKNGKVVISASQENSQLVFKVIDNGIGIDKDVLAGLFNPFKQADASTARQFGGTGLGLAISKQLCVLLGGSLDAVSETGKGSTFILRLPLVAAKKPQSEIKVSGDFLLGKRVLVAEDNTVNLMLATQILKKHGIEIDTAEDGKIAVAKVAKNQYDFILMDMQMPELSGTEATAEIRKSGVTTPIIAMTANASESDRDACLASGMNDFLSKPIEQQLLLQKLALWSATA
jgi:signal transduction histidine kinase/CheY-like chemotaxis protein